MYLFSQETKVETIYKKVNLVQNEQGSLTDRY